MTPRANHRLLLPAARMLRGILETYSVGAVDVAFEGFPRGACGATSDILARYPREFARVDALYASGTRGLASHAWVVADGWIVDITADQFGRPPVIVTQDDAWHRRWKVEVRPRPPSTTQAQWSLYPRAAWRAVVDGMAAAKTISGACRSHVIAGAPV